MYYNNFGDFWMSATRLAANQEAREVIIYPLYTIVLVSWLYTRLWKLQLLAWPGLVQGYVLGWVGLQILWGLNLYWFIILLKLGWRKISYHGKKQWAEKSAYH